MSNEKKRPDFGAICRACGLAEAVQSLEGMAHDLQKQKQKRGNLEDWDQLRDKVRELLKFYKKEQEAEKGTATIERIRKGKN